MALCTLATHFQTTQNTSAQREVQLIENYKFYVDKLLPSCWCSSERVTPHAEISQLAPLVKQPIIHHRQLSAMPCSELRQGNMRLRILLVFMQRFRHFYLQHYFIPLIPTHPLL
eukprot:Lankesteria_metandrocarpae@DN3912_c0_g1_i1.p1